MQGVQGLRQRQHGVAGSLKLGQPMYPLQPGRQPGDVEIPSVGNVDNILSVLDTFNIIRTLERAGDHTKNICEAVIFKLKGKKIDLG